MNKKKPDRNILDKTAQEFGVQPTVMHDDQKTVIMRIAEHKVKITITAETTD